MCTPSAKRARDEDEDLFNECRADCKRPKTLPFRASPTTKHTFLFSQSSRSFPPTPAESSDEENDAPAFVPSRRKRSPHLTLTSIHSANSPDSDLDMCDFPDHASSSPAWTTTSMQISPATSPHSKPMILTPRAPPHSNKSSSNINNARIPTPIYGHFNRPDPASTTIATMELSSLAESIPEPVSSSYNLLQSQQQADQDLFLRRRRLPSPISEDESMESPTAMTGGMLGRLDVGGGYNHSEEAFSAAHTMGGFEEFKQRSNTSRRAAVSEQGAKVSFSMGYRADCEKCRTRVPGHYSHVIKV